MNAWFAAAIALLVSMVPLVIVLVRADTMSRFVAFEAIGVLGSLTLVTLGEAFKRSIYADLGLVLAVTSTISNLIYARFFERWL